MDPIAMTDQIRAGFRDIARACALLRDHLLNDGFTRDEAVSLVDTWLGASIITTSDRQHGDDDG